MSRLNSLSASAIRAMFSSESEERLIMLVTIYDPETPSAAIARLADGYNQRLLTNNAGDIPGQPVTTDSEVIYGVVSRQNNYVFVPLQMDVPGEQETGVSNCSITINYVTPELIELIRDHLNSPAKVTIELVLADAFDVPLNTVEASFPGFYATSVSYSADAITIDLTMIDYAREPFPCYGFTPSYFPGLF